MPEPFCVSLDVLLLSLFAEKKKYALRVLLEEEVAQLVECAIPMRDLVLVCEVHLGVPACQLES